MLINLVENLIMDFVNYCCWIYGSAALHMPEITSSKSGGETPRSENIPNSVDGSQALGQTLAFAFRVWHYRIVAFRNAVVFWTGLRHWRFPDVLA